jgi:hypothetical protein
MVRGTDALDEINRRARRYSFSELATNRGSGNRLVTESPKIGVNCLFPGLKARLLAMGCDVLRERRTLKNLI